MTSLRLLASAPLLAAGVLSACTPADEDDPELGIAEVDRGTVELYAPGPTGQGDHVLEDDKGVLLLHNTYDEHEDHGHSQFRIYTRAVGVWTEAFIQTLCTDGNWVEGWGEEYVSPGYYMFVDVDCPGPYSVSEAWATVGLDY